MSIRSEKKVEESQSPRRSFPTDPPDKNSPEALEL